MGMKKYNLFITCEEAVKICDKIQYGEATAWQRFTLAMRLSWCNITRAYSNRNVRLTKALKKAKINCLKDDEREQLQAKFQKELYKYQ